MWSQLTTKQDYVAKLCPIILIGLLKEILILFSYMPVVPIKYDKVNRCFRAGLLKSRM